MDIEQLSKSQIVLLTLLVSFVTSIATGIVTVSLMDQAPPAIAQSVSRVIERTIQVVASTTPKGQTAATVVTQQKTIVVKESELIAKAVEHADPSIVRLYSSSTDSPSFISLGVVLDSVGAIASDADALGDRGDALIEFPNGARVRAFVTARDPTTGIARLTTATTTIDGKSIAWTPISISSSHPVLGETVVVLAGKSVTRIAAGIITGFNILAKDVPQVIETDIADEGIVPGSPLIDTDGSLVGIRTGVANLSSSSGFISASVLMKTEEKKN